MKVVLILVLYFWFSGFVPAREELRIIYVIHADGNYLFHDEKGNALDAADRILDQAVSAGEKIKEGEVFIFFQKRAENFLLFPSDEGQFIYYRNGLKLAEEGYQRKESPGFEPEAELLKKYSSKEDSKEIFLYYGHKIPDEDSTGYHASLPGKKFGMRIFCEGIRRLLNSFSTDNSFDLTVLSTCRNGTQETAELLSSLTDYLIASPADIHLSYLTSESLISISSQPGLLPDHLAYSFAEHSYMEMCTKTSTEISISLYDMKFQKNSGYSGKKGVVNFYRPPLFGKK